MSERLWPVLVLLALFIAWVISKVVFYARKSEEQWREADKSKLRAWEDDD